MDSSTQMSPVNNSASMASLVSGIAGWVIFLINVCVNLFLVPALTVITLGIGALLYLCILPLTCISPIAWIFAVVTGHVGMSQTKAAGQKGNSKATAGLVLNTHYALIMRTSSSKILVSNCNIKNNLRYGFYIEKRNFIVIEKCNIEGNNLFGIHLKFARYIARNNWWGSILGPSYIEVSSRDRITFLLCKIRCIPWAIKPFKNVFRKGKIFMAQKDSRGQGFGGPSEVCYLKPWQA